MKVMTFILALLLSGVESFFNPSSSTSITGGTSPTLKAEISRYQKMLEASRLRQDRTIIQNRQKTDDEDSWIDTLNDKQKVRALGEMMNQAVAPKGNLKSNGLPFDDHIYDHIKFVISKLTERMKSSEVLDSDNLFKLEQSIDVITKDINEGCFLANLSLFNGDGGISDLGEDLSQTRFKSLKQR